jgi:tetratricopeptide (TPR) repeat protein
LSARFASGELIGGRYRVHRTVTGGIGEVYFCFDERADAPVALKTLQERFLQPSSRNDRLRRRLEAETAIWASLDKHPNVVRCFYLTSIANAPFLCLEWIADPDRSNVSLHRLVASRGPFDLRRGLQAGVEICRGLLHVAEKQPNFVHRDLKVENVLIDQSGVAKVTDFGFSLVEGGVRMAAPDRLGIPVPMPEQVVGTPTTMAPEQWKRGLVDVRADVYGIGCILFRTLMGHGPFKGEVRDDFRDAHLKAPAPKLSDEFPKDVAALVDRCLAKSAGDRFQTMAELLDALESAYAAAFGERPAAAAALDEFTASDRINRGITYYHLGRAGDALIDFDAVLESEAVPAALYGRALAHQLRGRHEEALEAYAALFELEPDHASAYYNRANLFRDQGASERAIAEYTHALALDDQLADAYNNRGLLLLAAGDHEAARADFDSAIAATGSREARSNRAAMLLEQNLADEALDDLEQLATGPEATAADLRNRARARQRSGNLRGALDDYTAALAGGAQPIAELHQERALVYLGLGKAATAIEDLSTAIRHSPDLLSAYRARAQAYYDLGERDLAAADYSLILSREPGDAGAYYGLGLVLGAGGRFKQAFACLTEAARLGHNEAEAAMARFRRNGWVQPAQSRSIGGIR